MTPTKEERLAGGVPGAEYVGDVGELAPPSDEVVVTLESAGSVGLGREDGGAREGGGPGGTSI